MGLDILQFSELSFAISYIWLYLASDSVALYRDIRDKLSISVCLSFVVI